MALRGEGEGKCTLRADGRGCGFEWGGVVALTLAAR